MWFFVALLLVGFLVNLLLAVGIYFLVKKLASKSVYAKKLAWIAVVFLYVAPLPYAWQQLKAVPVDNFYRQFNAVPLPSDEYMIKHFYEHRAELEALVKAYREEHLLQNSRDKWDSSNRIKELKSKANVWRLASKSGMTWHENPYSLEDALKFSENIESGLISTIDNHGFDGVIVHLNNATAISFIDGSQFYKGYLHIPQIPKIEDSKLLYPINPSKSQYASQKYIIIKDSIDQFSSQWNSGECFVKSIESQWYIHACKSY